MGSAPARCFSTAAFSMAMVSREVRAVAEDNFFVNGSMPDSQELVAEFILDGSRIVPVVIDDAAMIVDHFRRPDAGLLD